VPTFLLERYWPGISRADAEAVIARETTQAETMRAEGRAVRVLRSTLVTSDEVLLSLVEAESELEVAELGRRCGAPADRIVPAEDVEGVAR
jgi:hypothetical protein